MIQNYNQNPQMLVICQRALESLEHVMFNRIGSMYGIYANIWGILMVNVTIYTIHGSYGNYLSYRWPTCFASCVFSEFARLEVQRLPRPLQKEAWSITGASMDAGFDPILGVLVNNGKHSLKKSLL